MKTCKDALMCEENFVLSNFKAVGLPSTTKFTKCGNDIVLVYEHEKKVAEVKLVCSTRKGAALTMTSERPVPSILGESTYHFELRTKFSCLQRPSSPTTTVSSTVTTPSSNTTVTTPSSNATVTTPSSQTTVTTPSSNTTVTTPSSNTTVTNPSSNATVTTTSSNTTVT